MKWRTTTTLSPSRAIASMTEQRQVANCVGKEGLRLPPDRFERLISDLEESIAEFLSSARGASFRDVHEALRRLWFLSHEDDPPHEALRQLIQALPRRAAAYMDGRAPTVIARLFPSDPPVSRFQLWARTAERRKLVKATRVLTAEGAQIVDGRSPASSGRRSGQRIEPKIIGSPTPRRRDDDARWRSAQERGARGARFVLGSRSATRHGRQAGRRPQRQQRFWRSRPLRLPVASAAGRTRRLRAAAILGAEVRRAEGGAIGRRFPLKVSAEWRRVFASADVRALVIFRRNVSRWRVIQK